MKSNKCLFGVKFLSNSEALAVKETAHYNREMRHRPIMINTSSTTVSENGKGKRKRKHYHTRSAEMEGSEVEQVTELH